MALNVLVAAPTLPPVYDGFGYSVDLYAGIIGNDSLVYEGSPNTSGNTNTAYTYEILQNGSPISVSSYGLTLATSGRLATTSDTATISTSQSLTNIAIRITDTADAEVFTSPVFTWVHSVAPPSIASLTSSRNWNSSLRKGVNCLQYMCAAEDLEGRAPSDAGVSDFTSQTAYHGIPVRVGSTASRPNVKISSASGPRFLNTNNLGGAISLFNGCIPALHFTTDTDNYIASNPELCTDNALGDVWIVQSMFDIRSLSPDTDIASNAGTDQPYGTFFRIRFSTEDNAGTTFYPYLNMQINETSTLANFETQSSDWDVLDGTGGNDRSVYASTTTAADVVFDQTADTDIVGANNGAAVYGDTLGTDTYILTCFHKGIYTNAAGNDAHKISIWFGSTAKDTPFVFFLPLHASNTGNTEAGLRLNSCMIHESNWYSTSVWRFDEAQWDSSTAYDAAKTIAQSQHGTDKNFPALITDRGEKMKITSYFVAGTTTTPRTRDSALSGLGSVVTGFLPFETLYDGNGAPVMDFTGIQLQASKLRIFTDSNVAGFTLGTETIPIDSVNIKSYEEASFTEHPAAGWDAYNVSQRRFQYGTANTFDVLGNRSHLVVSGISDSGVDIGTYFGEGASSTTFIRCTVDGASADTDADTTTANLVDGCMLHFSADFMQTLGTKDFISGLGTFAGGKYQIKVISSTTFDIIGTNTASSPNYDATADALWDVDHPEGARVSPVYVIQIEYTDPTSGAGGTGEQSIISHNIIKH
jgi:hypothetical protein